MRIRNKEHQSLGYKELQQLCHDYPNDSQLGEEIRKMAHAEQSITRRADELRGKNHYPHELKKEEIEAWESFITDINEREL